MIAKWPQIGLYKIVLCIVLCFVVNAKLLANVCILQVMPCPAQVSITKNHFHLSDPLKIHIKGMSSSRKKSLEARFLKQMENLNGIDTSKWDTNATQLKATLLIEINRSAPPKTDSSAAPLAEIPSLGVNEQYNLTITPSQIRIEAYTDFGAIHAISTLTQLIASSELDRNGHYLPTLEIIDKPKYKWRGLLIDSVRHFIPLKDIKRQLDGMSAAKLNVFHWHLNDDQGWRIESKRYPKLHKLASDNLYYTQADIREVVTYANLLGIRVLPEFDIPGHTSSVGVAYPELMAEIKDYPMQREWGVFEAVLDISNPAVYEFIDSIVAEFVELFPDSYIHIGGDEVNPKQWLANRNIQRLMVSENLKNSADIQHYFNQKVRAILAKHERFMMGWDEIYHEDLPQDIVIQSWRGIESVSKFANEGYQGVLSTGFYIDQPQYSDYHYRNFPTRSIASDFSADLYDSHETWTLNISRLKGSDVTGRLLISKLKDDNKLHGHLQLNDNSFVKVDVINPVVSSNLNHDLIFTVDSWMGPLRFELGTKNPSTLDTHRLFIGNSFYPFTASKMSKNATKNILEHIQTATPLAQLSEQNILGGEATLWSEMVTKENIDLRTWPRLFVIAERLWSPDHINNAKNMYKRLPFIKKYSANVVGLQHLEQQQAGFVKLLSRALLQTQTDSSLLDALMHISQLFEPAHYYTRHHIKYRQGKYHQQAPLDNFVDFLPVESPVFRFLLKDMAAIYVNDTDMLDKLKKRLKNWQKSSIKLQNHIGNEDSELYEISNDAIQFVDIALSVVSHCKSNEQGGSAQYQKLSSKLKNLDERQKEIVFAGVASIRSLLEVCQKALNKHIPYQSIDWIREGTFTTGIEGPAVDHNGLLYAVNYSKNGTIGRVSAQNRAEHYISLPEGSIGNGIQFDVNGNMYIADYTKHNILMINAQQLKLDSPKTLSVYAHSPAMNQPNDIAITTSGIIFASDPNWQKSTGQLWRIRKDRNPTLLERNMGTTNGIAVSPDNKMLYVNESVQRKVWQYRIDEQGNISQKRLLISFEDYGLDGMRTDSNGNLYIARYGKGVIAVVSPSGTLIREVDLEGDFPTNVAFGTAQSKRVFVTMQKRGAIESFLIE